MKALEINKADFFVNLKRVKALYWFWAGFGPRKRSFLSQ